MRREPLRCSVCGTPHGPGYCAAFEHLAAQVMHMKNKDDAIVRRSTYLAQFIFAVDDLLANEKSPKYRAEALKKIRRLRTRFANV